MSLGGRVKTLGVYTPCVENEGWGLGKFTVLRFALLWRLYAVGRESAWVVMHGVYTPWVENQRGR